MDKQDHRDGKKLIPVAQHFLQVHDGKTTGIYIIGLISIRMSIRGGDTTKQLLRTEHRWIYRLNSLPPTRLNEELYKKVNG